MESIIHENLQEGKYYQTNLEFDSLEKLLIKNLPTKVRGGRKKRVKSKIEYPSAYCLHNLKFIGFNTRSIVTITTLDFDKVGDKNIKDIYQTAENFYDFFLRDHLEVNYIVETDRGFQCGIVWNSRITTKFKKSWYRLKFTKQGFINKIPNLDPVATMRNSGIFRNPLMHKTFVIDLKPKSLFDYKEFSKKEETGVIGELTNIKHRDKQTDAEKEVSNIVKSVLKRVLLEEKISIGEGIRKAVLFQAAMLKARALYSSSNIDKFLVPYLNTVNAMCSPNLDLEEVLEVAKYAKKYTLDKENFVSNPLKSWKNKKDVNRDYYLKKNKKKEDEIMTRSENMTLINEKRKIDAKAKILDYITKNGDACKKKSGAWNKINIAENLGMSRNTVAKYLKEISI